MRLMILLTLLIGSARAQVLEKICLPEDDAGLGLSLSVDPQGRVHLSRIFRILGGLNYTVVDMDGVPANEEVAPRVSLLGIDEVGTTDLGWEGGAPRICYYNAGQRVFEVARREPGGWVREQVGPAGRGVGRWCNLVNQAGRLVVVFGGDDGIVRVGRRRGRDDWAVVDIDAVAGRRVGLDGSATLVQGRIVAAHRTEDARLRISWEGANGAFTSEDILDIALGTGIDPVAVDGGDQVLVVHGLVSPPGTSDGGLMITRGRPGAFRSQQAELVELGGANAATIVNDGLAVVTRYYRRNALFGSADGLRLYPDLGVRFDFESLEAHGSAEQRHTWNNLDITTDPFGFPVIAAQDEAEPFLNDRGSARVCVWQAQDTDRDRIPDEAEARYGTEIDNPDTDQDGRSDGEEVLDDGTDPTRRGADGLPDMGGPPADALVADASPPDAGPDGAAGELDMDRPFDASSLDQALGDGGRSDGMADAVVLDGATADQGRVLDSAVDRGLPDAARPDAARPDAALPDALVPDATQLDGMTSDSAVSGDTVSGETISTDEVDDGCQQGPGRGGLAWLALVGVGLVKRRRVS